jgi:DNA-binding response OmpR family regulator
VLRRVRTTKSAAELPIIMVTGKSSTEDVVEALNAGANDYITKPVDIEVAYARAEMQLRRKREEEGSRAAFRDLEQTLAKLQGAVTQAENTAALLVDLGPDVRAPLIGILGAASVLTKICDTPDLKKMAAVIESAATSLETLMSDALGHDERRGGRGQALRVLCADDDVDSRIAVRAMLEAAEVMVELVEASTGHDAAGAVADQAFDLVLMNLDMDDGLAGVRAIRRAERDRKHRRTPVLATSADETMALKALSAGADLHMSRPITAAGLLTALAGALSRESEDLSAVA